MTSACGPPVSWVWPRPMTCPSAPRMTQPTRGFGSERPTAFSARSSASRIAAAKACGSTEVESEPFKACIGSGLMRLRGNGRREDIAFALRRAGLVAAHDQEILRQERAGDVDIVERMLDVRIDRARAVGVGDIAADATIAAAVADGPAGGQQGAAAGPAAIDARRDHAAIGEMAVA